MWKTSWNCLLHLFVVTLPLWLWPWTISALDMTISLKSELLQLNSSSGRRSSTSTAPVLHALNETRESYESPGDREDVEVKIFKFEDNSTGLKHEDPHTLPLASPPECHPVYSFDTVGPYRQEEVKTRATERIYYYRETDTNEEEDTILTKDEFGLVCFTKFINCTVPPTASTASSRKTPNCIYFEKEFCTRKYGQMKWKGSVCPTTLLNPQDYKCTLRALGGSGGMEVAGSTNGRNKTLTCRNSDALCLALKPPFHTRSISDRNPPTQTMCLCPLGYTGPDCSRMDIDLFHLDLLHNIDLRNILLKYQQKDRYFIGVTLLFLLIVTLSSVLLIVAGVSFLFNYIQKKKSLVLESPERYPSGSRVEGQAQNQGQGHRVEIEEKEEDLTPRLYHGPKKKSERLSTVMRRLGVATAIQTRATWRGCVARWRQCWEHAGSHEGDEDYYDSDLEMRFHRSRMERRARLSQRGRVSV